MLLARGLMAPGRESPGRTAAGVNRVVTVTVITQTPAAGFDDALLPFRVVRHPGLRMLWRLLNKADVVHLAGPVLLPLALCFFQRKPVIVEHHGYQAVCPNGLLFHEPTKSACPGHFMARRYQRCLCCNAVMVGWPRSLLRLLLTFPSALAFQGGSRECPCYSARLEASEAASLSGDLPWHSCPTAPVGAS
jgi:hypothetical protein